MALRLLGQIKAEVAAEVQALKAEGITPGLAVILVGEVPASQIYVRSKVKTCGELGIFSEMLTPPESITTDEMLALVDELNARDDIDGILIQLPLPQACRHEAAARSRVTGQGCRRLPSRECGTAAERPAGTRALHSCGHHGDSAAQRPADRRAECRGRRSVGHRRQTRRDDAAERFGDGDGLPQQDALTLPRFTRAADILVAAIGRPGFVTAEMVKPGATLIDVGINRITDPAEVEEFFPNDAGARGDLCQTRLRRRRGHPSRGVCTAAGAYTPVPGGVGALTIAMLMQNTVTAAKLRRGISTEKTIAAMLRVGLTGGLGSGKSTAARLFAALGAHVLQSDVIGRELMEPGQAVYAAIVDHFGDDVVHA